MRYKPKYEMTKSESAQNHNKGSYLYDNSRVGRNFLNKKKKWKFIAIMTFDLSNNTQKRYLKK